MQNEAEKKAAFHDGALAMYKAITTAMGLGQPWPLPSALAEREFPKTCLKCGLKHAGACYPKVVL